MFLRVYLFWLRYQFVSNDWITNHKVRSFVNYHLGTRRFVALPTLSFYFANRISLNIELSNLLGSSKLNTAAEIMHRYYRNSNFIVSI